MLELRWHNNGYSRVLQYRTMEQLTTTDYTNEDGPRLIQKSNWSNWTNVPEVYDLQYKLVSEDV